MAPADGNRHDEDIRSARFRKGREESWRKLDELVTKLEKKGLKSLTDKEAIDLPVLYQAELSSLAVARNTVLDRYLIGYLEALSLRAYLAVYGPRVSLVELAGKFLRTGLPQAVWALRWHIVVSFSLLFLAILSGYVAVVVDNSNFSLFISHSEAGGRNFSATPDQLATFIYGNWTGLKDALVHFTNFLFRHNTQVSILCFSLGFFLGVPTTLLLIYNGLALGAMIGLHFEKGLGLDFIGWLSIHGVTELSAIVLSGAAGLCVAEKVISPGPGGRLANLAKRGRDAASVMIGVIIMLLVAGVLEGVFRQLIDHTLIRLAVATLTAAFWALYYLGGRTLPKDESA
ncbi:MAG: stage II sporulation protein M [Deltaproteobacteria bacterium]|nr:stage II sporulation protein M [Deltaproteobacteria bacterium]